MPIRVFTTTLLFALFTLASPAGATATWRESPEVRTVQTSDDDVTQPTINEFYPEERPLGDCLNNSIPLPNCGSDARGGWAQNVVFVALLGGLAFIAWRVVASSRRARSELRRTPAATTVPDDGGGDPAP